MSKPATILSILLASFSVSAQNPVSKITFGSCNKHDSKQRLWKDIVSNKPDLWIWLGDNIYGDTESMELLEKKYKLQKENPEYKNLLSTCPVIGIWDDHDYGKNDAGKEYPFKKESKKLLLDFLDEPASSERRKHEGAYASYNYGQGDRMVKVILLDGRYFRDSLKKENKKYVPNEKGDILGEEQWSWLENELKNSRAQINIVGCGIQFIPEQHNFEKWANFPTARNRLFKLIEETKVKGVFLISGDRHIAEISKMDDSGIGYPIYEITASGLTHSAENKLFEINKHRVGAMVSSLNFGMMNIDWNTKPVEVELSIRGIGNEVLERIKVKL